MCLNTNLSHVEDLCYKLSTGRGLFFETVFELMSTGFNSGKLRLQRLALLSKFAMPSLVNSFRLLIRFQLILHLLKLCRIQVLWQRSPMSQDGWDARTCKASYDCRYKLVGYTQRKMNSTCNACISCLRIFLSRSTSSAQDFSFSVAGCGFSVTGGRSLASCNSAFSSSFSCFNCATPHDNLII